MRKTQTMVCIICGEAWGRAPKRGRRPSRCPGCKEALEIIRRLEAELKAGIEPDWTLVPPMPGVPA